MPFDYPITVDRHSEARNITACAIPDLRGPRLHLAVAIVALAVAVLCPSTLRAAGASMDAMTTADMLRCTGEALDAANAEMATVYGRLHARIDPWRQERLQAAQAAWELYRDRSADFAASAAEGGTLAPLLSMAERLLATRERIQELKRALEEEG